MGALPRRASGACRAHFSAPFGRCGPACGKRLFYRRDSLRSNDPGGEPAGGEAASHLAQRPVSLLLALPTERKSPSRCGEQCL